MLPPLARADLALPEGWTDLLLDVDDEGAPGHYLGLAEAAFPGAGSALLEQVRDGLLRWRAVLQQHQVLSSGIVSQPATDDAPAVQWQVLTALVELPAWSHELDLGAVLATLFAEAGDSTVHAEAFPTDLGLGFGVLALPTLTFTRSALGLEQVPPPLQVGLALGLTAAPGSRAGLLTMGTCLDPEQLVELGAVVATVTGGSLLVPLEG